MGLKELTQYDIVEIQEGIAKHLSTLKNKSLVTKPYKVRYIKYDNEEQMLLAIFRHINNEVDCLLGWNSLKFDMLYLANRSITVKGIDLAGKEKRDLNYDAFKTCSPTGSIFNIRIVDKFAKDVKISVPVPYHVPVLDYMAIMEQFDYPKRSKYSLDAVSEEVLEGVKKVSYDMTLQELYNKNFVKFCLYNAIDSILVQLIDRATEIFDIVPTLSSVVEVPIHDALFAGMMCERKFQSFYHKNNQVFINMYESDDGGTYEGGLVKDPVAGISNYVMIYDFTSKFPSGMMALNLGIDTLLGLSHNKKSYISQEDGKIYDLDLKRHILAPNGYIYTKENGDSSLRTMVFDLFNGRVQCKEKAKAVDVEIQILEKTEGGKISGKFEYSKFEDGQTVSDQELYLELERLGKLSKKYANESQAMKIIMNSIYGVLGYRYFPLYNIAVASTVTAQSRDLLQYTIDIVNNFFRNEWKDKTDVHEALGIKVHKNTDKDVVIYADTDSIMMNMETVLQTTDWPHLKDYEKTRDILLEIDKHFLKGFFKEKFREYCRACGAFETRPDGVDSFKLGLEEINYKVLFVKKKRYIKNPIWSDGKLYKPNEKLSYKGIEVAKPSFPKFVRDKLAQIIKNIMAQEGKLDMFSVTKEAKLVREEFANASIDNISEIVRVNGFTKSIISDNPLMFISGAPQSHRAAGIHNHLIKTDDTMKKYPLISNGQKVGVYLTQGEDKTDDVFAYPVMTGVPAKAPAVDKKKQFEKMVLSPINNIIKKVDPNYKLTYELYVVDAELW